jgi:E3 ubiquitin-protein ligase HUWE1
VPTLDTVFNNSTRSLDEELSGMLRLLIDQRPHLAIPAIIHRLHRALDILEPLLSSTSERAFFSSFTQVPEPNSTDVLHGPGPAALEEGTSYAKALIIVDQLCTALSVAFQTQHYNHRTTTTMFTQANLTDMYVSLVEKLGKLHRSCVWEEVLLLKTIPKQWQPGIIDWDPEGSRFGPLAIQHMIDVSLPFQTGQRAAPIPSRPESDHQPSDQDLAVTAQANGGLATDDEVRDLSAYVAQRENTKVLQNLLARVPMSITPLFQSLGRMLLVRRSIDSYPKQNAFKVSDQIALAIKEQLCFSLPRNSVSSKSRLKYWIIILWHFRQLFMDRTYRSRSSQSLH